MFERGPFSNCPECKAESSFGILSAGGNRLNRRCKQCRYSHSEVLPSVEKKVIYLDQFALSEIFKVKSGKRRSTAGNQAFWEKAERQINRVSLLQRAIFPQSSIHGSETALFSSANELTVAHEMLGGETRFHHHHEIQLEQILEFAKAYNATRTVPDLVFDVDAILDGNRNSWLPDLHITVDMNLSVLADAIRTNRDEAATDFASLYKLWSENKPTFADALKIELKGVKSQKQGALRAVFQRAEAALDTGNVADMLDGTNHSVVREVRELRRLFEESGLSPKKSAEEVVKFWDWHGYESIPEHRISSYLFAAIARNLAAGQKRLPSRGMMNDITAISAYGPYVDAMFLDNECATFLSESPLNTELNFKARIFSTNSGAAFLEYLETIEAGTPREVRAYAHEIYGLS